MRRLKLVSALTVAALFPALSHGALIAGDSYLTNPPIPASSGGNTSGTSLASQYGTVLVSGFTTSGGGSGTAQFQTQSGGLVNATDQADATSSGKVAYLNPAGNATRSTAHNLSTVANSSVYYESYLVNLGSFAGTAAASGQSLLVGFGNATTPTGPGTTASPTGLFVGFAQQGPTATNGSLVIRYDSNSTNTMADATVVDGSTAGFASIAGVTDLVVAEIDVAGGVAGATDAVKWWLNPTDGTSDSTLSSTATASGSFNGDIVNDTNPGSSFARLNYISQNFLNTASASAYFDEPRLSNDLAGLGLATAPVPEPTSLTVIGLSAASLLVRRRRA